MEKTAFIPLYIGFTAFTYAKIIMTKIYSRLALILPIIFTERNSCKVNLKAYPITTAEIFVVFLPSIIDVLNTFTKLNL